MPPLMMKGYTNEKVSLAVINFQIRAQMEFRQTTVQALMLLGKLSSLRMGHDGIRPTYAIKLQMALMENGPCSTFCP